MSVLRSKQARRNVVEDQKGGVFVEHLVAFMPTFFFFMCTFQMSELYAGRLATDHAAAAAVRAAAVVLPDDPKFYGGEPINTPGEKRTNAVRIAAIRAMAPLVYDQNIEDVKVDLGAGTTAIAPNAPITVTVTATFKCKVALTQLVVCSGGRRTLVSKGTLPNQAARFTY
jgi:hypothetical protein